MLPCQPSWLRLALGLLVLTGLPAQAAQTSGVFSVGITLTTQQAGGAVSPMSSQGLCISDTLSAATHATVRVACSSGQFVSIEPAPGQPFLGTHGGAFRYHFGPGTEAQSVGVGDMRHSLAAGTVTAYQVRELRERAGRLELWVTF